MILSDSMRLEHNDKKIIDNGIADRIVEILVKSLETGVKAELVRKARLVREFAAAKMS